MMIMHKKILRYISIFVLIVFSPCGLLQPGHSYAASNTGTIKIFSEVKGIEIFLDEKSQGQDMAVLNNVEMGSHYIKAAKDGVTIFSELVNVAANATTTVLIKDTGQVKQKIMESKYKEQQEYKSKKLDILLSKSIQTVGSGYTSSSYFPGYYSIWGSEWTNMSSTAYETTDWKIVQGGVQEISDAQFAALVNDKDTQERISQDWDNYNNTTTIGAWIGLLGVVMVLGGGAAAFSGSGAAADSGAVICAVGFIPAIVGLGMLSKNPPSGHYVKPGTAAKQAYEYNQSLKKKLGLPETYEP
jgi:hypothetical protein